MHGGTAAIVAVVIVVVVVLFVLSQGLRIVQQYERGLVFRLGKVQANTKGPGLRLLIPVIDRMVRVSLQVVALQVPPQETITKDNVTLTVDAVVYFRVVDPVRAVVNVQNYQYAVAQVAQTSLRSVLGRFELDDLLSERDRINSELQTIIDEPTEGPWGVKIERVELRDIALPESLKRSMSRQAEAERERRARVLTAQGELEASERLAEAGRIIAADPGALQLRLLQTVVEVAAEKNSTLVMPIPVELLRFAEQFTGSAPKRRASPPA
jgi:regulator of protease activity HflC (stomatin/prohibitin superfamily)